jgi:hypothetical protein
LAHLPPYASQSLAHVELGGPNGYRPATPVEIAGGDVPALIDGRVPWVQGLTSLAVELRPFAFYTALVGVQGFLGD